MYVGIFRVESPTPSAGGKNLAREEERLVTGMVW